MIVGGNDPSALYAQSHYYHPQNRLNSWTPLVQIASLVPAFRAVNFLRGTKLVGALSWMRRPIHTSLAGGLWQQGRVAPAIISSLRVRKGLGAAALGYNLLNPFETIRHLRKGDYDKAVINFLYPIVGVPIYEKIVEGSSSQSEPPFVQQNGGPPALHTPKEVSDILSLGKISRPQSAHGFRSGKAPTAGGKRRTRRKKCPPGYFWSYQKRKCVRSLPWHLRQRQKYNQRSSNGRKR